MGAIASTANGGHYLGVYTHSWNNKWILNSYKVTAAAKTFVWQGGSSYANADWLSWQGFGQDLAGTLIAPADTSFPSTRFTANQKVQTVAAAQVWSLPTARSTLVATQGAGIHGTLTKVAGPIRTDGLWWWNVKFADGRTGWCRESDLGGL
jgi:hypothetical protein